MGRAYGPLRFAFVVGGGGGKPTHDDETVMNGAQDVASQPPMGWGCMNGAQGVANVMK